MCCSPGKEAPHSNKELPTEKPQPEEANGGLLSRPRLEKKKKERKNSAEYNVLRFSLTFQITFFFFSSIKQQKQIRKDVAGYGGSCRFALVLMHTGF